MKLATAEVSFNHLRNEGMTTCTVVVKNKVFHGTARCNHGDHFSRKIGRKVSMSKAMGKTSNTITKLQRKNVWNAYKNMTTPPRW